MSEAEFEAMLLDALMSDTATVKQDTARGRRVAMIEVKEGVTTEYRAILAAVQAMGARMIDHRPCYVTIRGRTFRMLPDLRRAGRQLNDWYKIVETDCEEPW